MNQHQIFPAEWMDAKQVKLVFCIGKTTLYHLAAIGRIRTVSLRENGKQRGKRLFSSHSIRTFLESQAKGGIAGP